ncbi:MAG: GGDEF domain-containing protein [Acidobacteria bacterium]|nr:GGDEF domain-containing protein [Acidobacteriota bacterium]
MTGDAEPVGVISEGRLRESAARCDRIAERPSERFALGSALEGRADEVVRRCQMEFVKHSRATLEEVAAQDSHWSTTMLAVHSIANWLMHGVLADPLDREQIASLGRVAVQQRETRRLLARVSEQPDVEPSSPSTLRINPHFELSGALITRLNLWWSEATRTVLAEEAARLKISRETLDEACDMVMKSCRSSLVLMAKQFDEEIQTLYERLTHLALHDPLTGLVNRALLVDWLDRAIARLARHRGGLVVAFMDLDNFKEVNDAFGHACGDDVLVELAARLATQMRPEDVVARFGGDEFVAVFEDLSDPLDAAQTIAGRLRSIVTEPIMVNGEELHMTISIGIAVVQGADCLSDDVLARADVAMYSVKKTGRNRIVIVEGSAPNGSTSQWPLDSAESMKS